LAQYSSVNAAAQQTAQKPFQNYGGQFVSPVNAQQTAGITNINAAAEEAQPYYGAATSTLGSAQSGVNPINAAATGLAGASAEQVNAQPLTGQDINQYLSPYLGDVLGTTNALANQNNSIAQSGALGTAISSGAFGGDRTGIAAANLNQQNSLAEQSTDANILNTGYNTALSTAQQQQGVNLSAGQANRAALGSAGSELASIGSTAYGEGANTASELGSLGSGAQAAGLAGAQAQIGAGTLQQQTAQAADTAEYNQFLQAQSYPFQVDQFLANIAEGTGALSGSTTTTTTPGGFFSDKRLKHDIKKIGKLYDGQEIYSYKMHGDPRTHIGLIAQKVEKKHPEAVGLAGGYKIVDYGKATKEAANRDHFNAGGLARRTYAYGGSPDLADILTAHEAMYGQAPGGSGAYGLAAGSIPRGGSQRVPAPTSGGAQLHPAQGPTQRPPTGMQNVSNISDFANKIAKDYQGGKGLAGDIQGSYQQNQASNAMATTDQQIANDPTMQGLLGAAPATSPSTASDLTSMAGSDMALGDDADAMAMFAKRGGRMGLASGGGPYSDDVGAGSTELGIPTASGRSEMGGLAAAPPPAQSGSSDPLGGLDKYDPAMQGLMASTQGQIKFDDGGVVPGPQTDVPQSLDIPDQSGGGGGGGNKLAVSTPPPGPSAGQQDMQDIMEVAGIVAMFANRGGRIGKADAGAVTDDSDPDLSPVAIDPSDTKLGLAGASDTMLPEITVTGQRPPEQGPPVPPPSSGGLAATPTAAPSVPADAKPDKDTPSTWTKIMDGLHAAGLDKATNVVPLLTGLAAMGTAPTKHLGVALAAGLGAGAQSYLPAQQQAADIQRTQIQNQMAGIGLQATRNAVAGPQGAPPAAAPATPQGPPPTDPAKLTAYYQQKYAVPPMTPQEAAGVKQAQLAAGYLKNPGIAQQAQTAVQNRIANETFQNQQAARAEHDQLYQQAVETKDPAVLAQLNAIHPFTGDQYEDKAGRIVNSRTGLPPLGAAAQTYTPEQLWEQWKTMASPTDSGAPARVPFAQFAKQNGITLPPGWQPPMTNAPARAATAPPTQAPARPGGAPQTKGPDFSDAPNKPAWLSDPNHVVTPEQEPIAKAYGEKEVALQDEAARLPETQQELIKAQRILNVLKNTKTGPGTDTLSAAQTVLGNMTGSQFANMVDSNPSAHALLAKALGNTALETTLKNMRESGAQVRLGQQESNLILNKLSASPDMPKDAIRSLIGWQTQQLQYDATRQNAILNYLDQRKNALRFENYYSNKNPLQSSLSTAAPSGTALPPRPGQTTSGPVKVQSRAEALALTPGTTFITPDGRTLIR
jgi:Chaperone of endosialidase